MFHPDVDDPYELAAAFAHDTQLKPDDASTLEKELLRYKSSVDGVVVGSNSMSHPSKHHLEIRSSALGAAIADEGRNGLEVWVDGHPHSVVIGPKDTPKSAADAFADAHSINNGGREKLWAELSVLWKRTEAARNAQFVKEKAEQMTEHANIVAQASEDIIAVKLLVNENRADLVFRLGDNVKEAAQFWCNELYIAGGDDVIDFVVGMIEQAVLNEESKRNSNTKEEETDIQNDTEEEFCPLHEDGYVSEESFWPNNLLNSWSLAIMLLLAPLGALLQRRRKCCSVP